MIGKIAASEAFVITEFPHFYVYRNLQNGEWSTLKLRMTQQIGRIATAEEQIEDLNVQQVTWSRDDRLIVTAISNGSLKVWDSTTGNILFCYIQSITRLI